MVMEGVEPSTVALLAQRSNQLSYTTLTNIKKGGYYLYRIPKFKFFFYERNTFV